jgi:hypothetical protein
MRVLPAANLAARFLCELAMLAALAIWGSQAGDSTALQVVLAIGAPALAAVIWGICVAPRAPRRLPDPARAGIEVLLFGAAAAGLVAAGHAGAGIALAALAAITGALVRAWPEPAAGPGH